jgi:hypothetical protein
MTVLERASSNLPDRHVAMALENVVHLQNSLPVRLCKKQAYVNQNNLNPNVYTIGQGEAVHGI